MIDRSSDPRAKGIKAIDDLQQTALHTCTDFRTDLRQGLYRVAALALPDRARVNVEPRAPMADCKVASEAGPRLDSWRSSASRLIPPRWAGFPASAI